MKKYILIAVFVCTLAFSFSLHAEKVLASPPHEINAGGRILDANTGLSVFQDPPNPNSNSTTLVWAPWSYDTKPGHFLLAVISFRGGSGVTITPPPGLGWTLAVRSSNDNPNSSGIPISTAIYYIKNAAVQYASNIIFVPATINNPQYPAPPSQQNPVYSIWTLNAPHIEAALSLGEYNGIDTNAPLDVSGSAVSSNNITIGSSGLTDPVRYTNEFVWGSIAVANRGNGFDGDPQQDITDISVYPTGYINPGYYFGAGTGEISYKDATTPSPKNTDSDLTKGVANINISNYNPAIGTKVGVKLPIMAGNELPLRETNISITLNPVAWAGAIATFKTNDSVGTTTGGGGGTGSGAGGMAPTGSPVITTPSTGSTSSPQAGSGQASSGPAATTSVVETTQTPSVNVVTPGSTLSIDSGQASSPQATTAEKIGVFFSKIWSWFVGLF